MDCLPTEPVSRRLGGGIRRGLVGREYSIEWPRRGGAQKGEET